MPRMSEKVIDQYHEALEADRAALREHESEIRVLGGWSRFGKLAAGVLRTMSYYVECTQSDLGAYPLPSQKLIRHLSSSIPRVRDKKRASDAAKVLLDVALSNQGTSTDDCTLTGVNRAYFGHLYCVDAERHFSTALSFMRGGPHGSQRRISTYFDEATGMPLAFRKGYDESTALLLRPVELEHGLVLPAGMIVGFGRGKRAAEVRQYRGVTISAFPFKSSDGMEFGRLSAWAFDDSDTRRMFALTGTGWYGGLDYDVARGRRLAGTTLEDFRHAASQILQMCEIGAEDVPTDGLI